MRFELEDLPRVAGDEAGSASSRVHRGGALPGRERTCNTVRVTFCLREQGGRSKVPHPHPSEPGGQG